MKRIYILTILLCFIFSVINAQVETHYYEKGEIPKLRKSSNKSLIVKSMPSFDVEKVKKVHEGIDAKTGLCHFGKGVDVSYTLADGTWEETDGGRLWTLKRNGATICTFRKMVSTSDGFDGTYFNGVTTKEINLPSPLEVLPGTMVTITSPNLVGATVAQMGGNLTPTYMAFNNAHNILYLGMPSSPTGAIILGVSCSGGSYYTLPVTNTLSNNQLSVTPSPNHLEISLTQSLASEDDNIRNDMDSQSAGRRSESIIPEEWYLEVYNVQTGEKQTNVKVSGSTLTLDTSSWISGVYVVRATIDKEVLSEKVYVK